MMHLHNRNWITAIVLGVAALSMIAPARGAETIPELVVDGRRYYNVRWGPVNDGKVVAFHNRGITTFALDQLPPDIQSTFGYKLPQRMPDSSPQPALSSVQSALPPAESAPTQNESAYQRYVQREAETEYRAYQEACAGKLLFHGQLVETGKLTELTGFLVRAEEVIESDVQVRGWVMELARRKAGLPASAAHFDLRPGLWEGTGNFVFLRDFDTERYVGGVARVYGEPDGVVRGLPAYAVGRPPAFQDWKRLRKR